MKDLSEKNNEKAFSLLREEFDRIFSQYCPLLRIGVPIKIFVEDNPENRLLMDEFRNYIEQRAKFEGWNYDSKALQIIYDDAGRLPKDRVALYNPRKENRGFRVLDNGFVHKISQKDADRIRDGLLSITEKP